MSIYIKSGKNFTGDAWKENPWRVYLIQRLNAPMKGKLFGKLDFNPFSNDRYLSKEGRELLHDICEFDYMGSAEFEFGAIPQALRHFADLAINKKLRAGSVRDFDLPVFYICKSEDEKDIEVLIRMLAGDYTAPRYERELKERAGLHDVMKWTRGQRMGALEREALQKNYELPHSEPRTRGWMTLGSENHTGEIREGEHAMCMFFVDETMFQNMCKLFCIENKTQTKKVKCK